MVVGWRVGVACLSRSDAAQACGDVPAVPCMVARHRSRYSMPPHVETATLISAPVFRPPRRANLNRLVPALLLMLPIAIVLIVPIGVYFLIPAPPPGMAAAPAAPRRRWLLITTRPRCPWWHSRKTT